MKPVIWFGVFDAREALVAVEEGQFAAHEIAKRLAAEAKATFIVKPVGIVPVVEEEEMVMEVHNAA